MANKKFRIKSFKKNKPILKLEKISLSFKRHILENISFVLNQGKYWVCWSKWSWKINYIQFNNRTFKPDYGGIIINNKTLLIIQ